MAAATSNQLIKKGDFGRLFGLVAATIHLYQGTLAFISATGLFTSTPNSGANRFAGVVIDEMDNTSGADGDLKVEVWRDGIFYLPGAGFSQATVGLDIYASDNNTVTTTAAGNTWIGYCVEFVSSTEIGVAVGELAGALASEAAATVSGNQTFAEGVNIVLGTATGTKIGTATTQKLGFFNSAPVVKPAALSAANNGALNTGDAASDTIIANMRTRQAEIESRLQALGLLS